MARDRIRGRDRFKLFDPVFSVLIACLRILPLSFLVFLFTLFRHVPWITGKAIRYIILKGTSAKLGSNISVSEGVYIFNLRQLKIGSNVSIHPMCYIECKGGVTIGNDVSIAHGTTIMSTTHGISDVNVITRDAKGDLSPVIIENNVWIGASCKILCGITIGEGAVVGAGSVVIRDVPKFTIVAGVPAKVVKTRK